MHNRCYRGQYESVITSLITSSKVSLYHLACYGATFIHKTSYEHKMRRLLDRLGITPLIFAKTIIKLFAIDSFELIIDRTNWMFGKTDINFLVLSITWNNLAIPTYWIMLNNKGSNSNSDQRIELVKCFASNFDKSKITRIYADREFPSIDFITWLLAKEQGTNFIGSFEFRVGNSKEPL